MSVVITDQCILCGACEWECPTEAIAPSLNRPIVNPAQCTECYGHFGESQCIVVCPVNAIRVVPEEIESLAKKYSERHPEHKAQGVRIWARIGDGMQHDPVGAPHDGAPGKG